VRSWLKKLEREATLRASSFWTVAATTTTLHPQSYSSTGALVSRRAARTTGLHLQRSCVSCDPYEDHLLEDLSE
jgi:hypothetical protein